MMFDCHEDFLKIEEAVLIQVNDYFAIIRRDVDSAWKENARKRLRDSAKARQKAAEARLVKLQAHQGALKAEIMKSITGESTFDTDLLKEMMEENNQAQAATEQETVRSGHAVELACVFDNHEFGRTFDETFSRTLRKMWVQFAKTGDPSLSADISPDGTEKVWPLYDLENKQVMIFDEDNIHAEKESERQIIDWDRTYFLTKYYSI